MALPDIQLDDRTFEDIVAEAKRRIPGYTKEWTDLNESDPGITLVELFAWLSEMIIWRLNKVPEKNFIKFLELIGIQPDPPSPAIAELTFKLSTKDLSDAVLIPQGTKVALAEQVDGKSVIFETDDNLYAVGAELVAVQSNDSARFEIVTEAFRVPGKFFSPFGPRPQRNAALYLGFDRTFPEGNPVSLMVHAFTADLIAEGKGIKSDFSASADGIDVDPDPPTPPVVMAWEYWAGDSAKWLPVKGVRDNTVSFTKTGTVVFDAPTGAVSAKVGLLRTDSDPSLFWIRARIEQVLGAGYEIAPRLEDVLLNTITATNAVTVTDELLGASAGTPNQTFDLANTPVLPDRFDLQVDEGEGFGSWTMVSDFAASTRTDRHFTLALAAGIVSFGDGEHGKIPSRLVDNSRPDDDLPNVKAATYRWGGGAGGNAGAKKITSLESSVPFVDSVENLRPSLGGQDEETVEHAKARAPETIRSGSRAVTAADFEFLAMQTPGARIKRAHALPLRHPDFEPTLPALANVAPASGCTCGTCAQHGSSSTSKSSSTLVPMPGVVTIVVVPEALETNVKPVASEDTLKLVGRWLNRYRLVTTELYVATAKYREVEIEARVIAKSSANSGQVAEALETMLLEYFHPLRGGPNGTGWEFGGTLYFSEVYRRILDTPGVARLEAGAVATYVDGQRQPQCEDIFLNEDELVFSQKHKIVVTYA